MDTPPEPQKSTRRRKIKTRIRRPEDPIAHLLHKRERRLEKIRLVRFWIIVLGSMCAIIWGSIWLWEWTQRLLQR